METNELINVIANAYHNRNYYPEQYPDRVEVTINGKEVSAIFSIPPGDSKGGRDFRMKELFNKVYIVSNDFFTQEAITAATKPGHCTITSAPKKYEGLRYFSNSTNLILKKDLFILKFFPDEESRKNQLSMDAEFYYRNRPVLIQKEQSNTCLLQ